MDIFRPHGVAFMTLPSLSFMTLTVIHDIVTMRALGFGSGFFRAVHHPLAFLRSHCCTQSYGTAPHITWDSRFWKWFVTHHEPSTRIAALALLHTIIDKHHLAPSALVFGSGFLRTMNHPLALLLQKGKNCVKLMVHAIHLIGPEESSSPTHATPTSPKWRQNLRTPQPRSIALGCSCPPRYHVSHAIIWFTHRRTPLFRCDRRRMA